MKKFIIKYNLELFTVLVLLLTLIDCILYSGISPFRKLINLFLILGVLHEWEEKRFPGGFFELMANKFGIKGEKEIFDRGGLIVVLYWIVITSIPYLFDQHTFLVLVPVVLGFFEAFVHTMGIFIHKMKKPYTPGLITAWIMAFASVYTIWYLESKGLVTAGDYLLGVVLMFGSFILMDIAIFRTIGLSPAEMKEKVKLLTQKIIRITQSKWKE